MRSLQIKAGKSHSAPHHGGTQVCTLHHMCLLASPSLHSLHPLHPLHPTPFTLVPYRWPEEDGFIVIDVIECYLEGLHGLVGWLALVAGHNDQLGREAKGLSWAIPHGLGDITEAGTERTAGWWRIWGGI